MRGTQGRLLLGAGANGIIPAHAGNTKIRDIASRSVMGSSPRMRGTHIGGDASAVDCGIIPAHAGNTMGLGVRRRGSEDHPRACGEHPGVGRCRRRGWGSSPRMRGTLTVEHERITSEGIIPAHAGNTPRFRSPPSPAWDHPRACGEHSYVDQKSKSIAGSSPRMRGTRSFDDPVHRQRGIIPAHAGNTNSRPRRGENRRDHPRACGEHGCLQRLAPLVAGSSPRMRGTR